MTEGKKHIVEMLWRVERLFAAYAQRFEGSEEEAPRLTVIQTRKTLTNTKTTKRTKGKRV